MFITTWFGFAAVPTAGQDEGARLSRREPRRNCGLGGVWQLPVLCCIIRERSFLQYSVCCSIWVCLLACKSLEYLWDYVALSTSGGGSERPSRAKVKAPSALDGGQGAVDGRLGCCFTIRIWAGARRRGDAGASGGCGG